MKAEKSLSLIGWESRVITNIKLNVSELSEVLWSMVMQIAFSMKSSVIGTTMIVVCFAFWAMATIIILVMMEGMSAFLHALRLHWYSNLLYTDKWNIEKYWWNKNCIFHFPYFLCKNLFSTAMKHIFRIFTGLLLDYFLHIFRSRNII